MGNLLREHVSVRNLPIIFETLADYSKMTSDVDILTEYTRQSLAKQITYQYAGNSNVLKVLTVSGRVGWLLMQYKQGQKILSLNHSKRTV